MTYAFALLLTGTLLLYSGLRNRTIQDVLRGVTAKQVGPGEAGFTAPLVSGAEAVLADLRLAGGGGGSPAGSSTSHYRPGQSVYRGVVICNWIIDVIKAAERDVGPLHPTSGVRHGIDPHTASGKTCHSGCAPGSGAGTGAVDFGGYGGSPDAERFRRWLAAHGNPMVGGASYGDRGHFSRDGS